ncbi:MAG: phosphoglycerate transporter [Dehalococcoidia bacterium]|nr:MAG: phosphoglycerate transporter [Dehalococcoidia bacterium]
MYKIGWFSSGRGEGSRNLLTTVQQNIAEGNIEAGIDFVFLNRERGQSEATDQFLDLVDSHGIPLICFSSRKFREQRCADATGDWRLEYDRQVMERLKGFDPDICVLAGYMLIVGREMCQHFTMINLHPAAPGGPAGTWREVIWKLIAGQASETGAMMHLVTPELDEGPPVTYCKFPIRGTLYDRYWKDIEGHPVAELIANQGDENPLFSLIRKEGVKRELPLIVATIKAFSEGRIRIDGGVVVDAGGKPVEGYSLTAEIDSILDSSPRD